MGYLCSQWAPKVQIKYFIFVLSNCRPFVLNTGWKLESLKMMIFVNFCSTWSMVEFKTRFEPWITRNDVKGVTLFHLSFVITLKAYLFSQWTPNVQMKYFMFDWTIYRLFVLNTRLETWLFPNHDIHICFLEKKHSRTKSAFWVVNNKKWRKWCKFVSLSLFNNSYGLPVLTMET
jgi:hypothetical protein